MVAMKLLLPAVVSLLLVLAEPLSAGKILGYFITPSRSHFIVHESLMRGLAASGNEVTVVSFFPPPAKPIANYTSIQVKMNPETQALWDKLSSSLLGGAEKEEIFFLNMPRMLQTMSRINREAHNHPLVEKLRRESKFDLVAIGWFFNEYQIGLATHFNCPAVVVASMFPFKPLNNLVGNPAGSAYTPAAMSNFASPMNFKNRLFNFGIEMITTAVFETLNYFVLEPEYRRNFPPESFPSYDEAKKRFALVLVSSHFSQEGPIASFPSMVEVSGMHIKKKPDPLPEDIQQWLDTAKDGVVYFSLGSNVRSTQMPAEKRDAILRAFGRIKQRVLWKWEDDELPGKPANVMVQKWLPQDDVLAHPNVKLFISHCGKGGVTEARYHGVPILGIPVFADQPKNLQGIVDEGWAVPLQYSTLNADNFEAALTEALTNKSYGLVVKRSADLFRDRPQHPLDTAVFWVEYVMRHKGAKHMQSQAVDLNWYQYHSLDVIATLLVAAWLCFKINVFIWRRLWRLVCGARNTQKTEKTLKKKKN